MTSGLSRLAATMAASPVLFFTTLPSYAQTGPVERYYHGPGMMWDGGYAGGLGMIFGLLFMVLVLAALVAAVVLVLKAFGVMPGGGTQRDTTAKALDILKERFARGDIDAEEFEQRKRILSN